MCIMHFYTYVSIYLHIYVYIYKYIYIYFRCRLSSLEFFRLYTRHERRPCPRNGEYRVAFANRPIWATNQSTATTLARQGSGAPLHALGEALWAPGCWIRASARLAVPVDQPRQQRSTAPCSTSCDELS